MPKRHIALIALSATAALVGLTACGGPSSTPSPTPASTPTGAPSAASTPTPTPAPSRTPIPTTDTIDGIKVTGDGFGKLPKVDFKAPFAIDKTRFKTLIEGRGPAVTADANVQIYYNGLNGSTGKTFQELYSADSITGGNPTVMSLGGVVKGFQTGLVGQREGSRVLVAMPGSDGYDTKGGNPDAGILVGDTLVFVIDIVQTQRTGPDAAGKVLTPPAGLPKVTGSGTGAPTVEIPSGAAPTSMTAQTLVEGVGPKVTADAILLSHYVGYSWATGKVIETAYEAVDQGNLASAIPGWQSGLVGKTVGSRVLLVLPPKDGFPEGSNNPQVSPGDTVVYVVDVLMAVSAATLG